MAGPLPIFSLFVLFSNLAWRLGSSANIVPFTSKLITRDIKMREGPLNSYNENENKGRGLWRSLEASQLLALRVQRQTRFDGNATVS